MSARIEALLDSNVLVYAASGDEPPKHKVAVAIVERGFREGCYAVSTQVLLESYVSLTRKARIRVPHAAALLYIRSFLTWRVVGMTPELAVSAMALAAEAQVSAWDAAILAAAAEIGCPRVLSEDLSDGQRYGGVEVVNPFAEVD